MKKKKEKAKSVGFKHKPAVQVVAVICAIFAISTIAFRLKGNASDASHVRSIEENESNVAISTEGQEVIVDGGGDDSDSSSDSDPDPEPQSQTEAIIKIAGEEVAEDTETSAPTAEEVVLSELEQEWQGKILPKVEDYLVVRESADKESEMIGKLYKGNEATILDSDGEWLKIQSGNMQGYVHSDYTYSGMDAYSYAKEVVPIKAMNQADGLRVRSEASTESTILTVLENGNSLNVNKAVEAPEGWTAVDVDGTTGYVKSEFVDLRLMTGVGITIEEEKAIEEAKRKAEEEKARAAEAERKAKEAKKSNSTGDGGVSVSNSELDMLAAIIECEAGGEAYDSKLAVGAVVINRMQSSRFPSSMNAVLRQSGQFTPVMSGQYDRVLARGASSSCYAAARDALAGSDNTGGCLFFRTANGREGLLIGNMVFY